MSKNSIYALVSQFLGQQNNISVPVPLVRIIGDYAGAAFTSQVVYWSDRSENTDGWFWKTHEQWFDELHLTSDQIRRCVRSADGLVEVKKAGVPARNYYRVNRELLIQRLQELADQQVEGEIVTTTSNGQTQQLEVDKPNDRSLDNPTASRTGNPTTKSKTSPKTSSKTTFKGGEYNVTGNARETDTPEAQASQTNSAPFTTTIASRLEDEGEADSQAASVAVLPPDGGDADASITDAELSALFGDQPQALEESETITLSENVPPAPPAVAALVAASDEAHDPEETRALLVPALGGQKKLNDLMEETPPGLRYGQRRGWVTQITPERAAELIAEGRKSAGADNPWTYIIRLLDKEVGARFNRSGSGGVTVAMPNSFDPPPPPVVIDAPRPADTIEVGTRWEHKRKEGVVVSIVDLHGPIVELDTGEQLMSMYLTKDYRRIHA